MNFTLNMLTMLALTLSVGIVIDDAIVVLENIYRFIEEKGMPPIQAAIEGTREIGLAVLATTMSLVAIFAPVGFMSGMVGRFMRSFGLTMAFAVMVSLLVSLHADADDVRAVAEGEAADARTRIITSTTRSTRRSSDRSIASTRGCSSGRWRIAAWSPRSRSSSCSRACRCSAS